MQTTCWRQRAERARTRRGRAARHALRMRPTFSRPAIRRETTSAAEDAREVLLGRRRSSGGPWPEARSELFAVSERRHFALNSRLLRFAASSFQSESKQDNACFRYVIFEGSRELGFETPRFCCEAGASMDRFTFVATPSKLG